MTSNEGSDHYVTLPFRKPESFSPRSSSEQTRFNGAPSQVVGMALCELHHFYASMNGSNWYSMLNVQGSIRLIMTGTALYSLQIPYFFYLEVRR